MTKSCMLLFKHILVGYSRLHCSWISVAMLSECADFADTALGGDRVGVVHGRGHAKILRAILKFLDPPLTCLKHCAIGFVIVSVKL